MKVPCVLLLAVLCSGTLATAQNPYPVGCWTFDLETVYCSEVHPGGGCLGSLNFVIVTPIGATGSDFGTYGTLSCTGGTLNCPGTNSPTCPTCPNGTYIVAATNPACVTTGGGGSGCTGGSPKCNQGGGSSPIIVDTKGEGFHLTSAENGVMFDFYGDGHPIKLSWTAADSGNAFLALDRNHNGKIDNAKELFGNITAQPKSDDPNGYLALAEFDKPENGGNGDGIIDSRDAVYSKLLLWIDENHDGISQTSELHTLPELGVYSISLKFRREPIVDRYGNLFRYRAFLNPDATDGESKDGRFTYDVFFVSTTAAPATAAALSNAATTNRVEKNITAVDHSLD
jgi:hypothetical protein